MRETLDAEAQHGKNVAVSLMLIGSVTFFMTLFYLTNSSMKTIRTKTWLTISSTVSVFSAITIYQATKSVLLFICNFVAPSSYFSAEEIEEPSKNNMGQQFVNFIFSVVWYLLMMIVLGLCITGYFREGRKQLPNKSEGDDEDELEQDLHSYGLMFAHIVAFCSQDCWISLQTNPDMPWGTQAGVLSATLYVLFLLMMVAPYIIASDKLRDCLFKQVGRFKNLDEEQRELWQDNCMEGTLDIAGIVCGLAIVNWVRYLINHGIYPSKEGFYDYSSLKKNGFFEPIILTIFGICFPVIIGLGVTFFGRWRREKKLIKPHTTLFLWISRYESVLQAVSAMGGAYAMGFGLSTWIQLAFPSKVLDIVEDAEGVVLCALLQSAYAFLLIVAIDEFLKRHSAEKCPILARLVQQMFLSCGLLIGVGWEHAFDFAIDTVLEADCPEYGISQVLSKVGLSILLALIVLPAWKWYIVPRVVAIVAEEQTELLYLEDDEKDRNKHENKPLDDGTKPLLGSM